MNKVYIGYQGDLPVRVESSRDAIKRDKFIVCDRIEEHEGRAELIDGKLLFDAEIDIAVAAVELARAKEERAAAVAALTVEVDGMVFDGDEKAQERMGRAVTMADSLEEETEWVLHDHTVAIVTAAQLRQACRKAGKAQTALWTVPYQAKTEQTEAVTEEVKA